MFGNKRIRELEEEKKQLEARAKQLEAENAELKQWIADRKEEEKKQMERLRQMADFWAYTGMPQKRTGEEDE